MLTTTELSSYNYEQLIVAEWYDNVLNVIEKTVKKPYQEHDKGNKPPIQQQTVQQEEQAKKQNSSLLSRDDIAKLQKLLKERGFNVGNPDGIPGAKTTLAIKQYQKQAGLPIDGKPSNELLKHLYYNQNKGVSVSSEKHDSQSLKKDSRSPKTKTQQNSFSETSIVVFGISLGKKFKRSMVAKVIKNHRPRSGGGYLIVQPHNPNPIFNFYKVSFGGSIFNGKGNVSEITAKSEWLKQSCEETMPSLIETLQNKYGHGREVNSRGGTVFFIRKDDLEKKSKYKKTFTIKANCRVRGHQTSEYSLKYSLQLGKRAKHVPYRSTGM